MITISKLSKSYGKDTVLKDISLDIEKNDKILIIGPSGSGKTTLIRCINRLEKNYTGDIYYDGINTKDIPDEEIRSKIGIVFQDYNLFPHLTVKENIELAPLKLSKAPKKKIEKRTMEILKSVGLEDKINEYPRNLSGGQQQRVAIARTLLIILK